MENGIDQSGKDLDMGMGRRGEGKEEDGKRWEEESSGGRERGKRERLPKPADEGIWKDLGR